MNGGGSPATGDRTYYASPTGGGNGTSPGSPYTLAEALPRLRAGNTLVLLDGIYTASLTSFAHGTSSQRITVRAANDGAVLIDGEGVRTSVGLTHDYLTVEGINACRSDKDVLAISGDYCEIKRCVGWDAADDGNNMVFRVSGNTGTVVEDCAGFGIARKTFSASSGARDYVFRRCFGIWEGFTGANGPTLAFTLGYKTYNGVIEDCIGMWNRWRVESAPDQPYGLFATDNYWGVSPDTFNTLRRCIGIVRAGDNYDPSQVILCSNVNEYTIEGCYMVALQAMTRTSMIVGKDAAGNCAISDTSLVGPQPNGWGYFAQDNVVQETALDFYGEGESAWNTAQGAQLDAGVFLAWPMRQRIIDAMTAAGYDEAHVIDVHAELTAVFGEP